MALKGIKYNLFYKQTLEEIAASGCVDLATKPDVTVKSLPCWNCGTYRLIGDYWIVEKCPDCGDDETDLSAPDVYNNYAQEREPNENETLPRDQKGFD